MFLCEMFLGDLFERKRGLVKGDHQSNVWAETLVGNEKPGYAITSWSGLRVGKWKIGVWVYESAETLLSDSKF